jgi:autophagy-related protein 18
METKIHIYDLPSIKLLHTIDTALNARGICAISPSSLIAFPRYATDNVVDDGANGDIPSVVGGGVSGAAGGGGIASNGGAPSNADGAGGELGSVVLFDALTLQPVNIVRAHQGSIAALTLNDSGQLLATASSRGTVIRVFTLVRRGTLISFSLTVSHSPMEN